MGLIAGQCGQKYLQSLGSITKIYMCALSVIAIISSPVIQDPLLVLSLLPVHECNNRLKKVQKSTIKLYEGAARAN